MLCSVCSADTRVLDTRTNEEGTTIRRRRECIACGKRFTTYERVENMPLVVLKKSGRTELFDPAKIMKGLAKACEKRPITLDALEEVVEAIEKELKNDYTEVPSAIIGETIMKHLLPLDQVAYVRFASVYKEFDDVDTFINEIEEMRKQDQQ